MKKLLYSTLIIGGILVPLGLNANASDTANTNSKVKGKAKPGDISFIAKDSHLGSFKIGEEIPSKTEQDLITVTDHSGYQWGWRLGVKTTNFNEISDNIVLSLEMQDKGPQMLTDNAINVADIDYVYGESIIPGTFSGKWGIAPKAETFKSDLVWTLTPEEMPAVWGTAPYTIDGDIMTVHPGELAERILDNEGKEKNNWGFVDNSIKYIIIEDGVSLPDNASNVFANFPNLISINGLEKVDTSNVTNMNALFKGDSQLETINVETWDVSNVRTFRSTFNGTESINELGPQISKWKVNNVTDMAFFMFSSNSTSFLDLNGWDISKATDLTRAFELEGRIHTLDMSEFDGNFLLNDKIESDHFLGGIRSPYFIKIGPEVRFRDRLQAPTGTYTDVNNKRWRDGDWEGLNLYSDDSGIYTNGAVENELE